VKPASIFADASAIPSTGSTAAAIDTDLGTALDALSAAGSDFATAAWIANPKAASYLARLGDASGARAYPTVTVLGGTLFGLPVLVSGAVPRFDSPTTSFNDLLDGASVLVVDDDRTDFSVSTAGAVHPPCEVSRPDAQQRADRGRGHEAVVVQRDREPVLGGNTQQRRVDLAQLRVRALAGNRRAVERRPHFPIRLVQPLR
jgi:hypothetical protein